MSDTAIHIEGIGKKYLIRHNKQKGESDTALRDVLSDGAKKIFKPKSWSSFKGELEEFWALKDINLEIKKGEKIGIIGKNGAGKSTLLKILSRITAPTEGLVKINGRVSSLLEVGTGFHPELTGRENIFLNGSILGMGHNEIKKQFDEIIDFSGVETFIDTPVKRYSSGMKTRLGFAIAAHLRNDVLILDEVLAVGDAEFQKKCLGKVGKIPSEIGKTIIFVSHNLSAVQSLCDKAVWLHNGEVFQESDVSSAVKSYLQYTNEDNGLIHWNQNPDCVNASIVNPYIDIKEFYWADDLGNMMYPPYENNNLPFLKLSGKVLKPGASIGYIVYNEEGLLIYMSTCADLGKDEDPVAAQSFSGKEFSIKTKLPDKFLNSGAYNVYPILFFKEGGFIFHPSRNEGLPCLSLEVLRHTNTGSIFDKPRLGVNAPLLKWTRSEG